MAGKVTVADLIKKERLKNLTPEIDVGEIEITVPDVNRPALQLTGFFRHFNNERVQIIGMVESEYLKSLDRTDRIRRYEALCQYNMPCIIYTRSLLPDSDMVQLCEKCGTPLLSSDRVTTDLVAEIIRWMKVRLAPEMTVHGVLVDVYGEGVLMTGSSGIGKSEVALELIRRGHRLVADDSVVVRKVSDATLVGTASEITRNFIELRGIGILDVKNMFGVESIRDTKSIDMIIELQEWKPDIEFERLGLEDHYRELMGNRVITYSIPVRPGRNVAVIVESAAINNRARKMGENAAQDLSERLTEKMEEADPE